MRDAEDVDESEDIPVCLDCEWFHNAISRAAFDPKPRADLEALYGAHLRLKHSGDTNGDRKGKGKGKGESKSTRRLRSV
jgi:hypothetical protein